MPRPNPFRPEFRIKGFDREKAKKADKITIESPSLYLP